MSQPTPSRTGARTASLALACLLLHAAACSQLSAQSFTIDPNMARKVQAAEFFISHFYVDSLSEDKVVDDAINGMLKSLDPHSTYVRAQDVERSTEHLTGSFEGVGVQFNMVDDTLVVVQPVSGGPCERMGIQAGDRFITVDDTLIAGVKMSNTEIMRRLRGPKDTQVRIGVKREGVEGESEFVVTRDKIPVYTLDAAYMIGEGVGYVRLSNFGQTTLGEFREAIASLREQGMTDLVLDLQGNGGGYLEAAQLIANEFLPAGALIVYTDGRAAGRRDYTARGDGILQDIGLVILVDSYTASAAEIVSGAIQDNDRGWVVGRRTFGKGLVQRPFELPDQSVIRLTVSHYYTPSGRCIQKSYRLGEQQEYREDISDRLKSGELTTDLLDKQLIESDSALQQLHRDLFPDSLSRQTLRLARTVYAGGGIMPDVYVPLDTTLQTPLYRQLSAKSCLLNTSLRYVGRHRQELQAQYPDIETFLNTYEPGDDVVAQLLDEARAKGITPDDSALAATLPLAKTVIKALIARDLWSISEYYQVVNSTNAIYQRGVALARQRKALTTTPQ